MHHSQSVSLLLTLMLRRAPKSIENALFLIALSWGMLGHLPCILTEIVAILVRAAQYSDVHHSAAVCSLSWNQCRDGPENLDKTIVFERFLKRAPLCSRLLILLWFGAPRRLRPLTEVSKKLTTLQPFAHFRHITLAVLIARILFAGYEIQMARDRYRIGISSVRVSHWRQNR